MQRRGTKGSNTAAYGLFVAFVVLILSASPATAQVPDPGELIEDVTGTVDDAATQAGDGVADVVEGVTSDVGGTVGGPVGQTVEDLGSTAGDSIRDSSSQAGNVVGSAGSAANDVLDDVTGGGDPAPEPNSGAPGIGKGKGRGRFEEGSSGNRSRDVGAPGATVQLAPAGNIVSSLSNETDPVVSSGSGPERTILDALGGITFPLLLVGIVSAFLAIQGKVDRSDPKLSIAILDPEEETLIFR